MTRIQIASVNGQTEFRVYKFQELTGRFVTMQAAQQFAEFDEILNLFSLLFKSNQSELYRCNPNLHNQCKQKLTDFNAL